MSPSHASFFLAPITSKRLLLKLVDGGERFKFYGGERLEQANFGILTTDTKKGFLCHCSSYTSFKKSAMRAEASRQQSKQDGDNEQLKKKSKLKKDHSTLS